MSSTELPDAPVVAWRESQTPWWAWPIMALALDAVEHRREVAVSVNGLTLTGGRGWRVSGFVPWDEVAEIDPADDPDLAIVHLQDGRDIVLDRWHLPSIGADEAKTERVDLLRRALAASRDAPA